MDALNEQVNNLTLRPTIRTSAMDSDTKMDAVPYFMGDPSQLDRFLMLLEFYFEAAPVAYATDRAKIRYAASRLDGKATRWVEPLYTSADAILTGTYAAFVAALKCQFSDRQSAARAAAKLLSLKHRRNQPVHEFSTEFKALVHQARWSLKDASSLDLFWMALDESIVNGILSGGEPKDLEECIQKAIEYDQRVLARRRIPLQGRAEIFKQHRPLSTNPQPRQQVNTAPSFVDHGGVQPMELDSVGVSAPRGRLTPAEKDFRRANGLCLYCGGPGHIALHCPKTKKQAHFSATELVEYDTPPQGSGNGLIQ